MPEALAGGAKMAELQEAIEVAQEPRAKATAYIDLANHLLSTPGPTSVQQIEAAIMSAISAAGSDPEVLMFALQGAANIESAIAANCMEQAQTDRFYRFALTRRAEAAKEARKLCFEGRTTLLAKALYDLAASAGEAMKGGLREMPAGVEPDNALYEARGLKNLATDPWQHVNILMAEARLAYGRASLARHQTDMGTWEREMQTAINKMQDAVVITQQHPDHSALWESLDLQTKLDTLIADYRLCDGIS